jgi:hypothetical protein
MWAVRRPWLEVSMCIVMCVNGRVYLGSILSAFMDAWTSVCMCVMCTHKQTHTLRITCKKGGANNFHKGPKF